MSESKIEWTDDTWNPVRGCSLVSKGCANCYAMKFAHRFSGSGGRYEGLTELGPQGPRWVGRARFVPEMLAAPLSWKRPRRVFVNSMSDLFHEDVTDEQIAAVFGVMAACPRHTFQILTKRPERAREWFNGFGARDPQDIGALLQVAAGGVGWPDDSDPEEPTELGPLERRLESVADIEAWPLPNVWLGVSVEDQATADARIPVLLDVPAAVRWVSAEPLLGPVDIAPYLPRDHFLTLDPSPAERQRMIDPISGKDMTPEGFPCSGWIRSRGLDWIVIGGESGHGARPFDLEWAWNLLLQSRRAAVPVFFKQTGSKPRHSRPDLWPIVRVTDPGRKGGDPAEWPPDLRVRQFPTPRTGILPQTPASTRTEKEEVPSQTTGIAGR